MMSMTGCRERQKVCIHDDFVLAALLPTHSCGEQWHYDVACNAVGCASPRHLRNCNTEEREKEKEKVKWCARTARTITNAELLRRHVLEWLTLAIDRASGPSAPDTKLNLLKAVHFVHGARYEAKVFTIRNCFKKASLVRKDKTPSEVETDPVEAADITQL